MICLFSEGTLNGLQFEMERPPYRIRAESLSPIPHTISAKPYNAEEELLPSAMQTHKRLSETYVRTEVHITTEGSLPSLDEELEGHIIVYQLERVW